MTPNQMDRQDAVQDPEERLRQMEEAAGMLAGRLAEVASTAALQQLDELVERYAETLRAVEEAQAIWLAREDRRNRESSD